MSTPEIEYLRCFSESLKKARGERSQADFTRFLGIKNQQTYQRYEDGKRLPNAAMIHQIANKLGVTVESLLTGNVPAAIYPAPSPSRSVVRENNSIEDLALFAKHIVDNIPKDEAMKVLKSMRDDPKLSDKGRISVLFEMVALLAGEAGKETKP